MDAPHDTCEWNLICYGIKQSQVESVKVELKITFNKGSLNSQMLILVLSKTSEFEKFERHF